MSESSYPNLRWVAVETDFKCIEEVRRASDLVYGCTVSGHEEGAGIFLDPGSMVVFEISLGPQRRRRPLWLKCLDKVKRSSCSGGCTATPQQQSQHTGTGSALLGFHSNPGGDCVLSSLAEVILSVLRGKAPLCHTM